jgi:uncharacterized protein (DUF433 family)
VQDVIISRDPEVLGGTPVFAGTRVPVRHLFEHLAGDYTVEGFLRAFPTVRREQVEELLNRIGELIAEGDLNA